MERVIPLILPGGLDLPPMLGFEAMFGDADLEPSALLETTAPGGQSLLHLAVYHDRKEWVEELSRIPALRRRRNDQGLTPDELATFLGRTPPQALASDPDLEICGPIPEIEYLPLPIFESGRLLDAVFERTAKAKRGDLIPAETAWMGIYFGKELQKGRHPKVSVRWIGEIGFGIFAEQKIDCCAFVGEYTGAVREKARRDEDNYYCVRYTSWKMGWKKTVVDAEKKGNFTRFINHSGSPNLGLQTIYWRGLPRMIFVSLKEIAPGEQLSFDYGNLFWKQCRQTPQNL